MFRKYHPNALFGLTALAALTGCAGGAEQPRISAIEAVSGPTLRDPSTLAFTIRGGERDVRLNNVFSEMAIGTRMIDARGNPVPPGGGIPIPAGQTVRFSADGPHVELLGVNRVARGLEEIELSFTFSDSTQQFATAPFIVPEGSEGV